MPIYYSDKCTEKNLPDIDSLCTEIRFNKGKNEIPLELMFLSSRTDAV